MLQGAAVPQSLVLLEFPEPTRKVQKQTKKPQLHLADSWNLVYGTFQLKWLWFERLLNFKSFPFLLQTAFLCFEKKS